MSDGDGTGSVSSSVDIDKKTGDGGGNEFLQQIPESYRDREYLKGIDSMDKFVEQFDNAQKLIGKKTVGIPNEESSIEEWNEFYNKMGRPESPEAYEFEDLPELPEGFGRSDEETEFLKKVFHEAGLTKQQANKILKATDEGVLEAYKKNEANLDKMIEDRNKKFLEAMDNYFGDEKKEAMAVTETMLKEFVPKGMEELVKGLDDNSMLVLSAVMQNIHKSGRVEDKIKRDVVVEPEETPESMRETAKRLMMSPEWKDEFHPNHEATKKKVQDLYRKIAGA